MLNIRHFPAPSRLPIIVLRRAFSFMYPKPLEELLEKRRVSKFLEKQSVAREAYDDARKNGEVGANDLKLLKADVVALSQEVLAARRLMQVMPDENFKSLHEQLIRNEKVHLFKQAGEEITRAHIANLIKHRLGGEGMNKDCQALVVPTNKGLKILGGIFRFHTTIPETGGMIDVRNLPRNVDELKTTPVEKLTGSENVTGYWTISSGLDGSGPVLVSDLSGATPAGRLETTISPIRGFTSQHDRGKMLELSDENIREKVLGYLLSEKDFVRNFHMGNGAYLGWIHINRDAPTDSQDWITVNYLYNRAELTNNQTMFKAGVLPVSPLLYRTLDSSQVAGAYNVCATALVPKPAGP